MPIKIHSAQSNEEIDASAEVAQEAILSGAAKLRTGKVHVRKGLQTGTVDAEDLATAVGQGWDLVEPERVPELQLQREESDLASQTQAGIESLLSGATIGLSDLALVESGLADAERMRARREGIGAVGTGLEIAGSLAPLLVSGGTAAPAVGARAGLGLAARGAGLARGIGSGVRALGAPVRAVEALGIGAERLAARGLGAAGFEAGGLTRTVVPMGVRGATEGVAFGMGTEISEATLGDREITAERLAAAGGMGMALGFGGGAALGGLGKIARGATAVPRESMQRVLARMADGTIDSTHPVARALGGIWGMAPEDVARGWQKFKSGEMADYFYRGDEMADQIRSSVHAEINGFSRTVDDAIRITSGERKMKRLRQMVPATADDRAPMRLVQDVEDLSRSVERAIEMNNFANQGLYEIHALNEAKRIMSKAQVDAMKVKNGVDAFRIAEEAKQQLGAYTRKLADMHKRAPTPRMAATLELLEGTADTPGLGTVFRDFLTDETIFGKAALAQKEIAAADNAYFRATERHAKGGGIMSKILRGEEITSRDAMLFVKRWGRAGNESAEEATDEVYRAQLTALQKRLDHYDLTPQEVASIKKASKHYESLQASLEKQRKNVDTYDLAQRFRNAEGQGSPSITALSTLGPAVSGLVGSTFGPIGAAAGFALGSLTRPYTMMRTLAGINDIATRAGLRIDKAVEGFVGKFGQRVETAPTRTLPKPQQSKGLARKAGIRTAIGAMSPDEREEKLQEVRARAQHLASSPEALQAALADMRYEVEEVAPKVSESIGQVTQRGAMYLAANVPKAFEQPWSGRPPIVSRVESMRFARRVEAAAFPIETLEEHLPEGTLTSEHVDALENVWPQIWGGVRTSIGDAVVQAQVSGKPIGSKERATLGRLFRVPIGPGAGVTMADLAAVYGAPDQPPPGGPQSPQPNPGRRPRAIKIDPGRSYTTLSSRAEGGLKD